MRRMNTRSQGRFPETQEASPKSSRRDRPLPLNWSACHKMAGRDRTGPVKGTAENRSPKEEPEALGTGGQPHGVKTQTIHRFSSLHHSLRERTGEGPVSSVPAATAADDCGRNASVTCLARQHSGGNAGLFATIPKEHLIVTILLSP
ncbi:hypothetical protein AAFF_G00249220 [Aldrovandia affinis]|uniref:Uncharacterized protein n=1 Tax=Aldrovandia affinis TaxID=143900 RepID=A0AAD7VX27_9TELE|nr:hypothetical protein AAFF_G00249220 [Aldrovandia affinis]